MNYWKTKDGRFLDVQAMHRPHIDNVVAMLARLPGTYSRIWWLEVLRSEIDRRDNPHRRYPEPIWDPLPPRVQP